MSEDHSHDSHNHHSHDDHAAHHGPVGYDPYIVSPSAETEKDRSSPTTAYIVFIALVVLAAAAMLFV